MSDPRYADEHIRELEADLANSRSLLKRYMMHVIAHEGISFIELPVYEKECQLTGDEVLALREVEDEVRKEYNL